MSLKKIAVFISGSGTNLQSLLDSIHNKYGEIALVVSSNMNAYGLTRAKASKVSTVSLNVGELGYDSVILSLLKDSKIDFIVLAGYMKKIPPRLIEAYENRIINIHPSLIPSFCGPSYYGIKVHEKAIEYGVKLSGATVHFVDEGMDTGPVIMQEAVEVDYEDDGKSLQKKVLEVEHRILVESVKKMCQEKIVVEGRKVKILP